VLLLLPFSSLGRLEPHPFQSYIGSPIESCELRVDDSDGACDLSCVRGPRVPCVHGRIRCDLRDIL
jgi:hypothetical protein